MSSDAIEETGDEIERADEQTGRSAKFIAGAYLGILFGLSVAGVVAGVVTGVISPSFAPTASPDLTGPIEFGARWGIRLFIASIAVALIILAPGAYINALSTLVADWAAGRTQRNGDTEEEEE